MAKNWLSSNRLLNLLASLLARTRFIILLPLTTTIYTPMISMKVSITMCSIRSHSKNMVPCSNLISPTLHSSLTIAPKLTALGELIGLLVLRNSCSRIGQKMTPWQLMAQNQVKSSTLIRRTTITQQQMLHQVNQIRPAMIRMRARQTELHQLLVTSTRRTKMPLKMQWHLLWELLTYKLLWLVLKRSWPLVMRLT